MNVIAAIRDAFAECPFIPIATSAQPLCRIHGTTANPLAHGGRILQTEDPSMTLGWDTLVVMNHDSPWVDVLPSVVKYCRTFQTRPHVVTMVPDFGMPLVGGYFPRNSAKNAGRDQLAPCTISSRSRRPPTCPCSTSSPRASCTRKSFGWPRKSPRTSSP